MTTWTGNGRRVTQGVAGRLVFKVELRGGGVFDAGFGAEVVAHRREQMRLDAAHEIQIAQGATRVARQGRRPEQTGSAPSEQIDHGDRGEIIGARHPAQQSRLGQTVAVLVEIDADAVATEIDDIGGTGAVGIGEMHTALVEGGSVVEPRHVVHGDLRAEAAIAEVGPIADVAHPYPHHIGQTITGHVGEIDGLRAIGEDQARSVFLVRRERDMDG